MKESEIPADAKRPQHDNLWLSLILNLVLPMLVLRKGKAYIDEPGVVLVVALCLPIGYFIYDWNRRRKRNLISILGFLSILMTGGIGLLELPLRWFQIKEALFPPGIIALVMLISVPTAKPLISLLFNREMFDVDLIEGRLAERNTADQFLSATRRTTLLLGLSFIFSAIANYFLAGYFVTAEPSVDKELFNDQVGQMLLWTAVILLVPNAAMTFGVFAYLSKAIKRTTGLSLEESLAPHLREKHAEAQ